MYQALYRAWRPRSFDDVVGQKHITETLKTQVKAGRLSHAYLFIGTRGTGKTTCAKILSRAVNCEHPVDGNPCNKCPSCLGIEDGSIMDVVELDAASNNGVDNVRALRDEAIYSPAVVKKRVYIIDEVHMLSTAAFNALLKIMEEPPEHLMFILATTELQKVPATILSRCQRHSFKRIDNSLIAEHLLDISEHEGFNLMPDAADLLARLSDGGMRDAISLLDQCSGSQTISSDTVLSAMGLAGTLRTAEILEMLSVGNTSGALDLFDRLWRDGKDPAGMLGELSSLMRDLLMCRLAPKGAYSLLSGSYSMETLNGLCELLTREQLMCSLRTVQSSIAAMRSTQNPKMTAELCLVSLAEPDLSDDLEHLRSRIAILEKKLNSGAVSFSAPSQVESHPARQEASPQREQEQSPTQMDFSQEVQTPAPTSRGFSKENQSASPTPDFGAPPLSDMDAPPLPEDERSYAPAQNAPAPEVSTAPSKNLSWGELVAHLRGRVNAGEYNIISDSYQSDGSFNGQTLEIRAKNPFALNMLSMQRLQGKISAAASELMGAPVKVSVKLSEPDTSEAKGNLDALSKFSNVKFE